MATFLTSFELSTQILLGQTSSSVDLGPWIAAGVLGVTAVLAALWGRKQSVEKEQVTAELSTLKSDVKSAKSDGKKQLKKAESRLDEVVSLKKDLASVKKKSHKKEEELKKLREELKSSRRHAKSAVESRPAFAETETPKAKLGAPVLVKAPPQKDTQIDDLKQEIEGAQQRIKALQESLSLVEKEKRGLLDEQRKGRRKVEQYRRVDLMAKSQSELLHERLKTMGRQYYDAVSEVAALKGEVVPPQPELNLGKADFKPFDAPKAKAKDKAKTKKEGAEPEREEKVPEVVDAADVLASDGKSNSDDKPEQHA